MINSVNISNTGNISAKSADNKTRPCKNKNIEQNKKNVSFGNQEQSQNPLTAIKDFLVILTSDVVGLAGFNVVLGAMQKFVNGNVLIGKINNHFMKNITSADNEKFIDLALKMRHENGLDKTDTAENIKKFVDIQKGRQGEAYFTHVGNKVVVGSDKFSALFHELGHAVEENCTTVLKKLQRFRGHYSEVALGLYVLMSLRPKKQNNYQDKENQTFGDKIKNFLSKSDAVIPLIAFSPELITEGMATHKGLDFLRKQVKEGALEKSLFKNVKRSYLTCFATYLFIPVSIMLLDALRNSANKAAQRHNIKQPQFYY